MTEDEALKIALDLLAEPARHGFYFEDDEHEAVRIALPRIQSALRLAEAVEWIEKSGVGVGRAQDNWLVAGDGTNGTEHAYAKTLGEAASIVRAKLQEKP